jgi:Flp pilus assembly protein TadG
MPIRPLPLLRAGVNVVRTAAGADPIGEDASAQAALKQAGQIVVIFALMLTALIGLVGIAIDTTYAWRESLRVQRAADAAALAGVVYMPGDQDTAFSTATDAAQRNGFAVVANVTSVVPSGADNPRELDVTISTSVPTFFSRIFGINTFTVARESKAVYVTPVPMGSPLAYYGVYALCEVSVTPCGAEPTTTETGSPANIGVSIASQGFYGAVLGEGSNKGNGDAFNPYYDNYNSTSLNDQYTSDGIRYEIKAVSSGSVYIFDPLFCATASKSVAGSGGHAGAGDHWLKFGSNPNNTPNGENTYFTLYDTLNLPLAPGVWHNVAHDYEINPVQVDKDNATYGNTSDYGSYSDGAAPPSSSHDCHADPHHNKWVLLGSVTAGHTYSLQVTTTDPANPAANRTQAFENNFSLAVTGTNNTIHGTGSMVTYANVDSGSQEFYLAQIDRLAGAGKTVEIDLFDPGDTSNADWLQIEVDSPTGWKFTNFSYTGTDPSGTTKSNSNTNCIQTQGGTGTAPSGCSDTIGSFSYQDVWVSIMIPLPTSYGTPSLQNSGWWKIKYTVNGGNDTTTWEVSIRGNPVHLI